MQKPVPGVADAYQTVPQHLPMNLLQTKPPLLCCNHHVLQPVGIANTVTKYQESRPLKPHLTPFEARVEAKMAEEEVVRAAVQSSGSVGENSAIKQLFDDGQAV